jgi:AcrR family transcriptional regulator
VSQEITGQKRGNRVRQLILETAIELVFEVGFPLVSVESIAARSGVAKTTIYRRWPNKAAVVMDAFKIGTMVSTGAHYHIRFISVVTTEDRKIVQRRDYMDSLAAMTALSASG